MSNFELSFKFRFQSTHPHGVRPSGNLSFVLIHGFQSTHPHGVRQPVQADLLLILRFNPRTHTGCDDRGYNEDKADSRGFNPRTHTGCDRVKDKITGQSYEFQSTHPHGVRLPASRRYIKVLVVSIHAPTRGATTNRRT